MKNISKLTVAALVAAVLTSHLTAAEPFLSPRAKASQTVTVPHTNVDKIDRSLKPISPRALANQTRTVPHTNIDQIDRGLPAASPRALENWPHLAKRATTGKHQVMTACKSMDKGTCAMPCKAEDSCKLPCCKA